MASLKSASKISNFPNPIPLARGAFCYGRNTDRRKRWAGVLFFFFFFLIAFAPFNESIAAFKMDVSQKDTFKKTFQQQITAQGGPKYTDQELDKIVAKYENDFNSFNEAMQALTDNSAAERLTSSADLGYGVKNSSDNLGTNIFFAPIIAALFLITYFLKLFVGLAGSILDITLNPSLYNFTGNEMIRQGWIVIRDICNLFFLIALLFIAFCTILKIDKYHAKKTLLMLIIMALLINFSRPIAVFVYDGSQLLMNFFLNKMPQGNQSASTMYNYATKISEITYDSIQKYSEASSNASLALQYLFAIVFLFMLLVAFLVIALFFIIRIVVIMMLIIVSPIAFFASVIPDFSKLSSSWWDALFKYSYYGPAAAFFLYLATGLSQHLPKLTGNLNGMTGDPGLNKLVQNSISYLLTLVFLYASIIMANKFGLQFSKAITDRAEKFMKWGLGATKTGGVWGWGARTTGVSGAVSSRLQQSKWTRWATKEGRKEAQEEREAWVGEKIGVKGAMERQIQKRAKKYKDEHYTEAALKAMATRGDAAAAFRLAEDGDMDDATYAAINSRRGYSGNVKKIVDKKLKKKQHHIFIRDRQNREAADYVASGKATNLNAARRKIAQEEFGKLSPEDWKEQDVEKITLDPIMKSAARVVYSRMNARNQQKVTDNMTGAKYAAGRTTPGSPGIW